MDKPISKRSLKCLKRIKANKSIPDIEALDDLETAGMVVCGYAPGELSITITQAGEDALRAAQEKTGAAA